MLARLLWESTVRVIHVFAHGVVARTSSVSPERDDALMCHYILDVLDCLEQIESAASSGGLISGFIVSSQVINSALSG